MAAGRIGGQADRFHVTLFPFGFQAGDLGQFGGADRGEILGMAEQHAPRVSEVVVQEKFANRAVLFEVRGCLPELNGHWVAPVAIPTMYRRRKETERRR